MIARRRILLPASVAALVFTVFASAGAAAAEPALAPGWNRIVAGEGAVCIDGTDYAFYVRPGSAQKLAVVFQGGTGCWSGATCDTCGGKVDWQRVLSADSLGHAAGLLDFGDKRNPIRDFTVVFVPNCTADVFLGSRIIPYPAAPNECRSDSVLTIRHLGSKNAGAVLDWVFAHVHEPSLVFVNGQSAGAIPSPFYAARIAHQFPHARVVQLGTAAGGYAPEAVPAFVALWGGLGVLRDGWGTDVPADSTPWSCEKLYIVAARLAPAATFAQINHVDDATQARYLKVAGIAEPVSKIMARNLALLHREMGSRFRSYTLPGTIHEVPREFYAAEQEHVKMWEWVASLIDGRKVADVGAGLLASTDANR